MTEMLTHPSKRRAKSIRGWKAVIWTAVLCCAIPTSATVAQDVAKGQPPAQTAPKDDDIEQLRKTVQQLRAEVDRLKAEVSKLEKYRQIDYLRDLLMKEEQRVLTAQKELGDIEAKEAALQKRLDEIDAQLRPDNIQQSLAGVGSMRPEEQRAAVERQLSNEKKRIQTQLDQLRQSRTRLQASIGTAEASIATLRQRLREAVRMAGLVER